MVDEVLRGMIARCRERRLRLVWTERETSEAAAVILTLHTTRIEHMTHREYMR